MRQEFKKEKLSGPEVDELLARLEELEETLRAIRSGEVDALVVSSPAGERVFTLQGAEHPYRVLVESMNEGAATLTPEGMLLYANLRFSQMIATPLEQLIGSSLYNIVQQPDECHLMDLLKKAEDSPQKIECQLHMRGGTGIPVYLSLSLLKEYDFRAISLIATDLSEQRQRELELARINSALEVEIAQRLRAEEAVRRDEQSLRELSGRLLQLQDEERRRIARDLHDSTGQKLVALNLDLNVALKQAGDLSPKMTATLAECCDLAEQCAGDIRTLSYLLHPPLLDEAGLSSAARWFVDGFARRSKIRVDLEVSSELGRMHQEIELALFRILQESLTNVHRHSGSPTAMVRFLLENGTVTLEVEDKGRSLKQPTDSARKKPVEMLGVGIRGMRERVRQLGGILELLSNSDGTLIRAKLPYKSPPSGG